MKREPEASAPPRKNLEKVSWHALEPAGVAARLESDLEKGLSEKEAARRLSLCGPNEVAREEIARWHRLLGRQFVGVLIWILIVAATIALVLGEGIDAAAILAIVVLNAVFGFLQEWKAERALAGLRELLVDRCVVRRAGEGTVVESTRLVPGDLVEVTAGCRVPADLRLVEGAGLEADESPLTGESFPVAKGIDAVAAEAPLAVRSSMLWMGTAVTDGRGVGLVVSTGRQTEFGRVAELTEAVERGKTPLQCKLDTLGRQLGVVALVVAALVVVAGWLGGRDALQMLFTGISLAVAVVPEGLPAVVTVTLALGIRAMVRRKALLRRLQAAEALGAATVVCTDKTGTLTQGKMRVTELWLSSGWFEAADLERNAQEELTRSLLTTAILSSSASQASRASGEGAPQAAGEPTEAALLALAAPHELAADGKREAEFPFSSARKRMTVVIDDGEGRTAHVKGAPEVLLSLSTHLATGDGRLELTPERRTAVEDAFSAMAKKGLRMLALARRELPPQAVDGEQAEDIEQGLTLLGVVGISDPPRPEVPEALRLAETAGIRVVMVTGDAAPTALAIARRLGLPVDTVLAGSDLEQLDDEAFAARAAENVAFARTTPADKLRLVRALQGRGEIVAMTGDGVNDAPALKQADIGVAMGIRGTDVAKGAADIVLTDDNFASIIAAIEEGRRQYENIVKFVRYLLSSNMGELIAICANVVLGGPLIFLPIHILWMNLITDSMTAIALGLEPAAPDLMQRPPRRPGERVLDRQGMLLVAVLGGAIGAIALALFQRALGGSEEPEAVARARTVAFCGIIVAEKVNVLNFRSLRGPLSAAGVFSNPWIYGALAAALGLQVAAVYVPFLQRALHTTPLPASDWLLVATCALPVFLVPETVKWIASRRRG